MFGAILKGFTFARRLGRAATEGRDVIQSGKTLIECVDELVEKYETLPRDVQVVVKKAQAARNEFGEFVDAVGEVF